MALENNLYGLAYECPYIERKDNCLFKELDQLSFKEKVDWIDGLSQEKKSIIRELHLICSRLRENKGNSFAKDDNS